MLVIGIIGILAAITIPNVVTFKNKAIRGAAQTNLEVVRSALNQYAADKDDNNYPTGAMIGDFNTLCDFLDDYGLTFDKNDSVTALKWKDFKAYDGAGRTYTVTITANDSSGTTFYVTLSGIQ